jgi:hypothetical protein
MSNDTAVEVVRVLNALSSFGLFLIVAAGSIQRWRHMRPSERLFSLGFGLYTVHAITVSLIGLRNESEPSIATAILPVANIWLIGAIGALLREYRRIDGPLRGSPDL